MVRNPSPLPPPLHAMTGAAPLAEGWGATSFAPPERSAQLRSRPKSEEGRQKWSLSLKGRFVCLTLIGLCVLGNACATRTGAMTGGDEAHEQVRSGLMQAQVWKNATRNRQKQRIDD